MTKKTFEELEHHYGKHSSWAIWDADNCFPKYNLPYNELQPTIVIVGLNRSKGKGKDSDVPWHNFHTKGHGPDTKLKNMFNDSVFRGAYITDLDIRTVSKNSREATPDFKIFAEQLDKLGSAKYFVIPLGKRAYNALKSHMKTHSDNNIQIPDFTVYHPAAAIAKEFRVAQMEELVKQHEKWTNA